MDVTNIRVDSDFTISVSSYDIATDSRNSYDYSTNSTIVPLKSELPVIVAIDPSKSNLGLVVGDISGHFLGLYEVSGSGKDTTKFCLLLMKFLALKLSELDIALFGQEKVILGDAYQSMVILNEIRSYVKMTADQYLRIAPSKIIEVNNFAWKSAMLPAEYRKKKYKKGSLAYIKAAFPYLQSISDDLTDAMCIYQYLKEEYERKNPIYCVRSETCNEKLNVFIVPKASIQEDKVYWFQFNKSFSLQDNIAFYGNRSTRIGCCQIPIKCLEIDDLYRYTCMVDHNTDESDIYLLIRRSLV